MLGGQGDGELGYSLLHAYGAAFDNPELIADELEDLLRGYGDIS
jgi:hypothetical protein